MAEKVYAQSVQLEFTRDELLMISMGLGEIEKFFYHRGKYLIPNEKGGEARQYQAALRAGEKVNQALVACGVIRSIPDKE